MGTANNSLVPEAGASMSSDWTSPAIPLDYATQFSLQLMFSGALVGTFELEACNSKAPTSSDWSEVPNSSQAITEGGTHWYLIQNCPYRWVRLKWSHTSGNGSLNYARFNTK